MDDAGSWDTVGLILIEDDDAGGRINDGCASVFTGGSRTLFCVISAGVRTMGGGRPATTGPIIL